MRTLICCCIILALTGCFKRKNIDYNYYRGIGYKPVYGIDSILKKITYSNTPQATVDAGNIYVKGNYLYQVETGKGIHVINNANPSMAAKVGFITINGCSQISIKGNILYSNNYDDLVMVDIGNSNTIREVARTKNAFVMGRYNYPHSTPPEPGYYQCPVSDSLVIGWVKGSVYSHCYKN
ncbi:MAG: hypothetical protein V4685_10750 [Bacteroidota bacterium]